MTSVHAAVFVLGVSAALSAQPQQRPPVFRGGVDLVSVDVVVVDRSGVPVTNLTAADFTVVAGKKPRRIVSAEYVNAKPPASPRAAAAPAASAPAASSNTRQVARTLLFVVDVENILSGEGRLAMQGIADYLGGLGPDDRAGLVALPSGNPRIEPTTDRAAIREAVRLLAGTSMRLRDREMTFGEAAAVFGGQRSAVIAYWYRILHEGYAGPGDKTCAPPKGFENLMTVPAVCVQAAERVLERARYHTRSILDVLRAFSDAMAPLTGLKSIVLVSGGVMTDPETLAHMGQFTAAAERSRVTLHTLFIEAPPVEAVGAMGNTSQTKALDNQLGLAGLADLAVAARGAVHRIQGPSTTALTRIDGELSGYYLLTFERDPVDRSSARVGIEVRTTRDGVDVIARKEFSGTSPVPAPPAGPPADVRTAIGDLLKSPVAVSQIPMAVDAFALPVGGTGDDTREIVVLEIGRDPQALEGVGFQIADGSGRVVADGFEAPVSAARKADGWSILLPAVALRPGRFIARFAAVDADGQRGSVQHAFEITPWTDGPIRLSDLIFGDTVSGGFRPAASAPRGAGTMAVRLVVRDSASAFAGISVRMQVSGADGAVLDTFDVPLTETPDPLRRFADLDLKIGRYAAGEYVVTAIATAGGAEIARRGRTFRK